MQTPMTKVQIIGVKPQIDATIRALQQLGAVQIAEMEADSTAAVHPLQLSEATETQREEVTSLLTRVEAILATVPGADTAPDFATYERVVVYSTDELVDTMSAELEVVEDQARTLVQQRDQLEEEQSVFERYATTLEQLVPLIPPVGAERAVTAILMERDHDTVLEALRERLNELTDGHCEIVTHPIDGETLAVVLIFPQDRLRAISTLLGQERVAQVRLPAQLTGQNLSEALNNMQRRLDEIPVELAQLEEEQSALAHEWRPRLLAWQAALHDHRDQIDVRTRFGQTDYTFVISGWIPRPRRAALEAALADALGDDVLVNEVPLDGDEHENAPVLFDNPRVVQPFEPLVRLLGLPQPNHLDPTPLMALFLPLFFGMILGDVAYGIILLALMAVARRRLGAHTMLRSLANVLMIGAVWSILFGFLYGEFLGNLGEEFGLHPLWFHRGENVQALFLLTIGVGVGHIVLGLVLGLWEAVRQRDRNEVLEKIAMLVALTAVFLLVAILVGFLPDSFFTPAIAILVIGVAVLGYSLGRIGPLLGPLELISTLGNILSYLRIAAVGLASVYLAQVANELAGTLGNLILGLIIAALIHGLNIVLGAFSPTIQSLRLHYVEFFDKFYESGGRAFQPFARSLQPALADAVQTGPSLPENTQAE